MKENVSGYFFLNTVYIHLFNCYCNACEINITVKSALRKVFVAL